MNILAWGKLWASSTRTMAFCKDKRIDSRVSFGMGQGVSRNILGARLFYQSNDICRYTAAAATAREYYEKQ
jgi:hypothetical protein